jgi:glycosyltransferase involved in cell wall biosynthesis
MHILVLADNFVPEQNAPALRTYEHCRRWVESGVAVTVITTVPNFPLGKPQAPYRNRLYQRERIDGIDVVRVWTFLAPNKGVVLRALDFVSFAMSSFVAGLFQQADIILATSPQLLTGLSGQMLSIVKRRPWIFEVRDLWPESIIAVGALRDGVVVRVLRRLEHALYRGAARIVTLTDPMRISIADTGVPISKIGVVSNGAGQLRFARPDGSRALAAERGLAGKFIVGYVGTLGMAQGLEVVVRAAEILRDSDIHFLLVGDGARRMDLEALTAHLGLANVTFIGMVPADIAIDYLMLSDAIVVPLKPSHLLDVSMPSKIFEAAAVGRPIILSAHGYSADVVNRYGAGAVVEPGNPNALAAAIAALRSDPKSQERFRLGCFALARDFDRQVLADLMLQEIRSALSARVPV